MTGPADIALEIALATARREGVSSEVRSRSERARFVRHVREHVDLLYGLARRLGPLPDDAEDLVQESLLKAWRGYGRLRRQRDARAWLCRILLNVVHDRRRRHARLLRRRGPRGGEEPDPASHLVDRDVVERVLAGVQDLPLRQRECLLLRARAGLSYREIGDLLGIQEGVVKTHLVRGRRALLRRFGEEVKEWGIENR
jgi:RNA polymerase sigma factor (sigma-70 family)